MKNSHPQPFLQSKGEVILPLNSSSRTCFGRARGVFVVLIEKLK